MRYFEGRQITKESVSRFSLGYSEKQDSVVIPVHSPDGMCIGFVARTVEGKEFKNTPGLPKSKVLFNLHRIKNSEVVYLVESSFDAIRLDQVGFPAVATLGANVSVSQTELLKKYFNNVVLIADNDDAGKTMSEKLVERLGSQITIINIDKKYKDIGDMDDESIRKLEYRFDNSIIAMINALVDKPKSEGTGLKVRWVKLADGQSAKIRFVNELDSDSAHFNEDRGLAVVVSEHTNPKDYKRKAACTQESEGRCFGCEMARKEPKSGWRARLRFYTNVLVDDGLEDPYVAVWSQGISKQSAFNTIREYALETGSVSNVQWKLKRNGQGTETNYTLIPSAPDAEPFAWENIEPFNLEKVVREVPYPEQEAFYFGFDTPSVTSTNVDW